MLRLATDTAADLKGTVNGQIGDAGGEFNHLESPFDLVTGFSCRLPVLLGDELSHLSHVLLNLLFESREKLGPFANRRECPGFECVLRFLNCDFYGSRSTDLDLGENRSVEGTDDVEF